MYTRMKIGEEALNREVLSWPAIMLRVLFLILVSVAIGVAIGVWLVSVIR